MGNVLSTLRQEFCVCCSRCCSRCCKRCRCCCKEKCLTEEEKIQIIYDKIRSEDIWDSQV